MFNFVKLDKNNLPPIGVEVLAKVNLSGVKKVYLVNDPDHERGFFNLFKPVPAWYCRRDNCFYGMDMVKEWSFINLTTILEEDKKDEIMGMCFN